MNANQKALAQQRIELAYKRAARLPFNEAAPINVGLSGLKSMLTAHDLDGLWSLATSGVALPAVVHTAYDVCKILDHTNEPMLANYFELAAGKFDGEERDYKVIDQFRDFGTAWDEYQACQSYHFTDLTYVDHNGKRWAVELNLVESN